MFFFEGKEVLIINKRSKSKIKGKVLLEEKEFFIIKTKSNEIKIFKKNIIIVLKEKGKLIFFQGNSLIHNPVNRIKRFKKKILKLYKKLNKE